MTKHNLQNILETFFAKQAHVVAVYLFGSYAEKKQNEMSDVDIAVLYDKKHVPDLEKQLHLKNELETFTKKDVDLVILNSVSPILVHQVFKKGIPLLIQEEKELSRFFVRSLTDYADLKVSRRFIEHSLMDRKIHG